MTNLDTSFLTHTASTARNLRLFLDYDGTLAKFAPTPDTLLPDPELISLFERLIAAEGILPAVISGRKLSHIQQLLPVQGLMAGGTYGMEMQLANGQARFVFPYEEIRPNIEQLIPRLKSIIGKKPGFFLEDKGWAVAIHGRLADPQESTQVMDAANQEIKNTMPDKRFHVFFGDRFLEYAPVDANKAVAVRWVLDNLTPKNATVVYIGDDDKDEDAFPVINQVGGLSVRVSTHPTDTLARFRMTGPDQVRAWLKDLLIARKPELPIQNT